MPLYELEQGTSRKFYRIDLDGRRVLLHWGRIGTEGEHQILSFETELLARAEYERQCDKRAYDRGYREVFDEGVPHDPEMVSRQRLVKAAPLTRSPRFLFVHSTKQKFAWVEARGDTLVSVKGMRTDEDKLAPTTKPCGSATAAIRARDAMIAKLLGNGYELETFGADQAVTPRQPKRVLVDCSELEQIVAEDPYDNDRWSVLEDWLLQHEDDPRSELVDLAKQRQVAEEAQARGEYLPLLLGKRHTAISRALIKPLWRGGYLVECGIAPQRAPTSVVEALLAAPATRLLRELSVIATPRALPELCSVFVQTPSSALRRLELASQVTRTRESVELDCDLLSSVSLRALIIRCATIRPNNLAAVPTLEEVDVCVTTVDDLHGVLQGSLPRLEALTIHAIFDGDSPEDAMIEALRPLVDGSFAPALRSLTMVCTNQRTAGITRTAIEGSSLALTRLVISP